MATHTKAPVGFVYAGWKGKRGSPCSGFSLCCIVHLLLLPDVLLLLGVVKLADPLFAAGLESGRVGLREQRGRRRAIKTCDGKRGSGRAGGPVTLTLLSSASRLKFISAILSNVALRRENQNKKRNVVSVPTCFH